MIILKNRILFLSGLTYLNNCNLMRKQFLPLEDRKWEFSIFFCTKESEKITTQILYVQYLCLVSNCLHFHPPNLKANFSQNLRNKNLVTKPFLSSQEYLRFAQRQLPVIRRSMYVISRKVSVQISHCTAVIQRGTVQ